MTRLDEQLARLTPAQRALFELKLRERRQQPASPAIGRRTDRTAHQLSFAQERLWFVERLLPAGAANHIAGAVRLEGPLSYHALLHSLNEIVRRHEVLRSRYVDVEGRPVQRIAEPAPIDLPVVAAAGSNIGERLHEARRLAATEAERPFDLASGVPLRALLIRVGDDDHVLVLVLHHIVSDAWSLGVFIRELSAGYEAFLDGDPPPASELSIQYADFAAWQRSNAARSESVAALNWWRDQLTGLVPVQLPTDFPRPAVPSGAGARESLLIDRDVVDVLRTIGHRQSATLFSTLLAAFQVLVARWTGQADVAIGSPVAGRNGREVEELIGLFVNMVVLRSRVAGDTRFVDFLGQVRRTVTAALERHDTPFEQVVEALDVERTLSTAPVTPVVFALQNVPASGVVLRGLRATSFDVERTTSRFDLALFGAETPDGLQLTIEYRSDLFERETIARLLGSYARLLRSVADNPAERLDRLRLLDDRERHHVIVECNATERDYPRDATIHELVSRQAALRPDAVAVACGADRLTYAELDQQSEHVAHALRMRGVERASRVGVCLDRSTGLIVALLGVLKAGCAYVALDSDHPPERLRFLAEDSRLSAIVTATALAGSLDGISTEFVFLDHSTDTSPTIERQEVISHPDDPAYVSYTSGSTGMPKGVEVGHRAVVRLLCGVDYARFSAEEVLLHLAPVAFDASTFEIWGALVHGARLVVYPERVPRFDRLEAVLTQESVTTMWLTASLFNTIIDQAPQTLRGLRQLLIGGEALSVEHVRRGMAALPETTIVNGYGPTEGTTFTCCHQITRADADAGRPIPLGHPIANTTAFVLDGGFEPVPVGVPGELFIGGTGLAIGYVSAPRLTAERFVPDGLSGAAGARLYRSGDLVRRMPSGVLSFLGRRDGQVKVRGYRVEPGEIESVLTRHPDIAAAVVTVWEPQPGSKALAAYLVAAAGRPLDVSQVRAFVKQRLPDYMVPAAFTILDAIPLTSNGKVDKQALPPPDVGAERRIVLPTNEVEEIVVAICEELLGPPVSLLDNFFGRGGHSLLAMQLSSRLEHALSIDVPIRLVFQSGTLAELSETLAAAVLDLDDARV